MKLIDTEQVSTKYRDLAVRLEKRELLITNLRETEQAQDLTDPPNCDGFGRIRHFRRGRERDWPDNPLPIEPALRALGRQSDDLLIAQVFQNAVCNWRCWYCFVPFSLLSAHPKYSAWMSADALLDLYLGLPDPPPMIDLSGGQPDLVPEWVVWMMEALERRGVVRRVYLWSDDNLSNDFLWRYLSNDQLQRLTSYPMYGRVACFKGFDAESFQFNTAADGAQFQHQFSLFRRLLSLGIDLYAYATFTTPAGDNLQEKMCRFVDALQEIHPNLPLRTVPLEIDVFTPVKGRLNAERRRSLDLQRDAVAAWRNELEGRFTSNDRSRSICDVPMRAG